VRRAGAGRVLRMNKSVYLAGPITGLDYEGATSWRTVVADRFRDLGIDAFSPLRCKAYLATAGSLKAEGYDEYPLSSAKGITTRDRHDVMTCDLVLVNLVGAEKISIGTMIEVGWADAARKPIVMAIEPGNPHHHAMLTTCAGFVTDEIDHAIDMAAAILLSDGEKVMA
jgi:nucleoside 2-deoxyribosyltransferase